MATDAGHSLSDAAVVRQVLAGDRQAFRILVERHGDRVYRAVARIASSPEDAEDLAQETFLKAFRSLGAYDPRWAFSTWVATIATRTALSAGRRVCPSAAAVSLDREEAPPRVADHAPGPLRHAQDAQWRRRLGEELAALGERMRVAFGLRYEDGLSVAEIAQATDASPGAVKVLLHRARRILRERLREFCEADTESGEARR